MKPTTRLLLSVIVLLILSMLYLFVSNKNTEQTNTKDPKQSPNDDQHWAENRDNTRTAKRKLASASSKLPQPTHDYAKLKDFMILELKLDNITFKQALYQLRQQYYEICKQTGETPIPFRFEVHNASSRRINFVMRRASFTSMLQALAAIGGMELQIKGKVVSFKPIEKTGITETFDYKKLTFNLIRRLSSAYQTQADSTDESSTAASALNPITSLSNLLGTPLTTTSKSPNGSESETILITADSSDILRIESLLDNYLNLPYNQKAIISSGPISINTPERVQAERLDDDGTNPWVKLSIENPEQGSIITTAIQIPAYYAEQRGFKRTIYISPKMLEVRAPKR